MKRDMRIRSLKKFTFQNSPENTTTTRGNHRFGTLVVRYLAKVTAVTGSNPVGATYRGYRRALRAIIHRLRGCDVGEGLPKDTSAGVKSPAHTRNVPEGRQQCLASTRWSVGRNGAIPLFCYLSMEKEKHQGKHCMSTHIVQV
jgi:hypothetical protein